MIFPIGTLVNVAAVLIGGGLGLGFRNFIPERFRSVVFQAIGLFTIILGIQMALSGKAVLVQIFGLVLGALIGHGLKLEERFELFAESLKGKSAAGTSNFSAGLVTAFVLYCIGSMTFLGSIEEGLTGERSILYTKSVLDGFSSIVLAAALGRGVLFSVFPMFILQAGLTWLASAFENTLDQTWVNEISATGGYLILGIGLNLLQLTKLKLLNFLPALFLIPLLLWMIGFFESVF